MQVVVQGYGAGDGAKMDQIVCSPLWEDYEAPRPDPDMKRGRIRNVCETRHSADDL